MCDAHGHIIALSSRRSPLGALKGSISYTLYHVEGELPADFVQVCMELIEEFRFQELGPASEEDMHHGWCVIGEMLNTTFTREKLLRSAYLCLGMRVDKWALPGALLKALIEERNQKVMEEHQKLRLMKSEKEAIREAVTRELKHKLLPAASMVDMVWNLDEGHVRFWSQSTTRRELFEELFESTFGVRLVATSPYVAALHCGLEDSEIASLDGVEQSRFTDFG